MFYMTLLLVFTLFNLAHAHQAPFHKGMYCLNGPQTLVNYNSDNIVHPLYQLEKKDWWFHAVDGCDKYPPAAGDFLELPAGKSFTVEIASNRGKTSLSFGGQYKSEWPDGASYPENYNLSPGCITSPNLHTQNQSMAAGTAFAISYNSKLEDVTAENLVVFSVRYHTPWKRITTYDVPADMPACPEGGCVCAWGWIPNGCGIPNMYMVPYRCKVTGATSTKKVGTGKPPLWCENDQSKCVAGPKQMLFWNQASGNNIQVSGWDLHGDHKSPAYNAKCGFKDGAQDDIFTGGSSSSSSSSSSGSGTKSGSSSSVSSKPASSSTPHSSTRATQAINTKSSTTSSPASTNTVKTTTSSSSSSSSGGRKKCSASSSSRRRSISNSTNTSSTSVLRRRSTRHHRRLASGGHSIPGDSL